MPSMHGKTSPGNSRLKRETALEINPEPSGEKKREKRNPLINYLTRKDLIMQDIAEKYLRKKSVQKLRHARKRDIQIKNALIFVSGAICSQILTLLVLLST